MRQSRAKCNIFGQARRPAPTRACRGDSPWSPGFKKIDFDAVLLKVLHCYLFTYCSIINSILFFCSGTLFREFTNPLITFKNTSVTKGFKGISWSFTFKIIFLSVVRLHKVCYFVNIPGIKIGNCGGEGFIRHHRAQGFDGEFKGMIFAGVKDFDQWDIILEQSFQQ